MHDKSEVQDELDITAELAGSKEDVRLAYIAESGQGFPRSIMLMLLSV